MSGVGPHGDILLRPELRDSIVAVRVDPPGERPAYEQNDAAFVAAIKTAGGRVSIGFKPPTMAPTRVTGVIPAISRAAALDARQAIEARGARIVQSFVNSSTVIAEISPELGPILQRLPFINYVEPIASGSIAQQTLTWGVQKVRADQVWYQETTNSGQASAITILDTGMDYDHLYLSGGDGPAAFVTDVTCLYAPGPLITGCWDDNGHGSHVAGIAAGRNNSAGHVGIAWAPRKVNVIKVCTGGGTCDDASIAGGLDWTVSNGGPRQVVSMSFGLSSSSSLLAEYISRSYNAGNLLIAAAGNNADVATILYPAAYSQVIAVTGTLPDDTAAGWITCANENSPYPARSNFGSDAELSAPFYAHSMWLNGAWQTHCGTSMATPAVAGVAALVWTKHQSMTRDQVAARLRASAIDLGTLSANMSETPTHPEFSVRG